ncbi:activin receptor type-2A-like [Physella acuta]|uniref:activin receptor type-2A-like n=1 Tax=Physella acuta TaxID=109671 RepID=UPI0027DDAEA8|nr:activin receptor type-2A-like [Physella acuta]XP_059177510.1 activin receptor type-2A-like [Physella acuta]
MLFVNSYFVNCNWMLLSLVILLGISPYCSSKFHKGTTKCEKYDREQCLAGTGPCTPTIEECANTTASNKASVDDPYNYMLCFASWLPVNTSAEVIPIKKGCWMNDEKCYNQKECVEYKDIAPVFFCCCDGDLCNEKFYHRPIEITSNSDTGVPGPEILRRAGEQQLIRTVLYSIVPIVGFVILVVTLFFMWRRHQRHMGHTQLPTVDPSLVPTPSQSSLNLQLLELKARGRYGSVWKAQLPDQYVAVKIFPLQDKQSWMAELDIYNLPQMKHENILRFIASERKEDNLTTELWLITEFHEKGSLCDFLKGNTITWAQLCHIGYTMTRGLAYLHDEIPSLNHMHSKPAVAHRDFKSKNVLLKQDLTACIADFGLALKFEPGKGFNETHPQVGTRRYMAPEVLEGAICFNRDSFLRIDMYACGLIIWELMTRCSSADGPVDDYRLPFEAEVGLQPTLEEMQTLVVTRKERPALNPIWQKHPGLYSLISTVEECWDQDAEARLSAGCVHERICHLSRTVNSGSTGLPVDHSTTPLLTPLLQHINTSTNVPNTAIIDVGSGRDTQASTAPNYNSC